MRGPRELRCSVAEGRLRRLNLLTKYLAYLLRKFCQIEFKGDARRERHGAYRLVRRVHDPGRYSHVFLRTVRRIRVRFPCQPARHIGVRVPRIRWHCSRTHFAPAIAPGLFFSDSRDRKTVAAESRQVVRGAKQRGLLWWRTEKSFDMPRK
jgi:hypothetical protein